MKGDWRVDVALLMRDLKVILNEMGHVGGFLNKEMIFSGLVF